MHVIVEDSAFPLGRDLTPASRLSPPPPHDMTRSRIAWNTRGLCAESASTLSENWLSGVHINSYFAGSNDVQRRL